MFYMRTSWQQMICLFGASTGWVGVGECLHVYVRPFVRMYVYIAISSLFPPLRFHCMHVDVDVFVVLSVHFSLLFFLHIVYASKAFWFTSFAAEKRVCFCRYAMNSRRISSARVNRWTEKGTYNTLNNTQFSSSTFYTILFYMHWTERGREKIPSPSTSLKITTELVANDNGDHIYNRANF